MSEKKFKFSFEINPALCMACATCWSECKFDAVREDLDNYAYQIDQDACRRCSRCYNACPVDGAIVKIANE